MVQVYFTKHTKHMIISFAQEIVWKLGMAQMCFFFFNGNMMTIHWNWTWSSILVQFYFNGSSIKIGGHLFSIKAMNGFQNSCFQWFTEHTPLQAQVHQKRWVIRMRRDTPICLLNNFPKQIGFLFKLPSYAPQFLG